MENTLCIVDAVMPWVYSWTLAALTAMVTIQCRANNGSDFCNCPFTLHTHTHTHTHKHTSCLGPTHTRKHYWTLTFSPLYTHTPAFLGNTPSFLGNTHKHYYPVCKAAASMASCCDSVFSVLEISWARPTCWYQPDWSNTPTAAPKRLEQQTLNSREP